MPNPAHILETALLILVAYLAGCVVGYLARRLLEPKRAQQSVTAAAAPAPVGAPLATAPTIAPLPAPRSRSPAERMAAAAGRSPIDEPALPPEGTSAPAPAPVATTDSASPESVIVMPPPAAEPAPIQFAEPPPVVEPALATETAGADTPPVDPEPVPAAVV